MARLNSFYLPTEDWTAPLQGEGVWLSGSEGAHLAKVLRTPPGTRVRLFDGHGREGMFLVSQVDRRKAYLVPEDIRELEPRTGGITLAVGWTRASRRGWLLEKSVELEASGVVFWQAERSQGRMPPEPKPNWTERTIQAAKQCFNPWLPELDILGDIHALAEYAAGFDRAYLLWEDGEDTPLLSPAMLHPGRVLAVVGPEGGITGDEAEMLKHAGVEAVTLGDRILRLETAVLHCLGLAFHAGQVAAVTAKSD